MSETQKISNAIILTIHLVIFYLRMSWLLMRWLPAAKLQPSPASTKSLVHVTISPASFTAANVPSAEPRVRPSVACILFFTSVMDNVTLHNFTIIVLIVTHLTMLPTAETFITFHKEFNVSFGFGIILESDNNNNNNNLLYFCRI